MLMAIESRPKQAMAKTLSSSLASAAAAVDVLSSLSNDDDDDADDADDCGRGLCLRLEGFVWLA